MQLLKTLIILISVLATGLLLIDAQMSGRINDDLFEQKIADVPSPQNHIGEEDIHVFSDRVIIDVENPKWSTFTATHSMDPVIDVESNSIEVVPASDNDVRVGDIVSYSSRYADGMVIHRIIEIDNDEKGWFAYLKGDNNILRDPGKVRFDQIRSITVGIIY